MMRVRWAGYGRSMTLFACVAICAVGATPAATYAAATAAAAARLNERGPENEALALRVGRWDVTETVWDSPRAAAVSTTGLVADRRMVGSMLEETLHASGDASHARIARIDYLTYDRVEARWEYVSMDFRAPVGIMTAQSFTRGDRDAIDVTFQPFAIAGGGSAVTGQMLRMSEVVRRQDADHDVKEQYFILADGVGTRWLAHRYRYVRRR